MESGIAGAEEERQNTKGRIQDGSGNLGEQPRGKDLKRK